MPSNLLSLGLLAAGAALAQTPPYFEPSTSQNVPVTFDAKSTNPSFFITGGVFSINATQSAPQLYLPSNRTSYGNGTLPPTFIAMMVDPDAPSPQNTSVSEILHWLQPGVRLSRSTATATLNGTPLSLLSSADTGTAALTPYQGPQPPSVAPHRYVILLFRQPDAAKFDMPAGFDQFLNGTDRMYFNATAFVAAAGLDAPLAANYFLAGLNTTGDGSALYTGTDAAPGVGAALASSSAASASGSSATSTGLGAAATQSGSGAGRLSAGALVGGVFAAMLLLS